VLPKPPRWLCAGVAWPLPAGAAGCVVVVLLPLPPRNAEPEVVLLDVACVGAQLAGDAPGGQAEAIGGR
jgi:hypothetical protein